jgi:adenine-specific DNA-methyltransferase
MTDDLKTVNLEAEKLDLNSLDIAAERQAELLRLFPEVRTEGGKVDFDRLRLALGEVVDVGKERYGMNWPGKADCFKAIQRPSLGTLLPVREESVNFDETENLIIEGDNLEVLKLLQKSYQGKIKMIYIDPPYNTGNDFIYPDNYSENLQTYLEYTGQVDSEGRKFSNNLDSDGRFHSRWMNMMYPRLYLARNLLREDGMIFVSIDDAEISNLRAHCNSIFGEENFLSNFVRRRRLATGMRENPISPDHEYVLAYARDLQKVKLFGFQRRAEDFPFSDSKGSYRSTDLTVGMTRAMRPNQYYPIRRNASGPEYFPPDERVWRFEPTTMQGHIDGGNIIWPEDNIGGKMTRPRYKTRFDPEDDENTNPVSTWINAGTQATDKECDATELGAGLNQEATKELRELFGEQILEYPKPVSLLRSLVSVGSRGDDLVLDFFAGSGTTAQALLEANREDSCTRRFILVQLPEPTAREDFKTIADITKERVRRVIQRHEKDAEGKLKLGNQSKEGFRVLKLATSNFKIWNAATETTTPDALAKQLELQIDHIQQERTSEDLLYEILLKAGFPPTTPIETLTVEGKTVYSVTGYGMLICLERQLTHEMIKAIAERKPNHVVCLDEGFAGNDQLKTNAVLIMKSKGVTKFQTI